jgi:hypothetical protein
MGLIGIAMFDDSVDLVKVEPATGLITSIAVLFDEMFEGLLSGSVSSLSEERGIYYFVAHGRYVESFQKNTHKHLVCFTVIV